MKQGSKRKVIYPTAPDSEGYRSLTISCEMCSEIKKYRVHSDRLKKAGSMKCSACGHVTAFIINSRLEYRCTTTVPVRGIVIDSSGAPEDGKMVNGNLKNASMTGVSFELPEKKTPRNVLRLIEKGRKIRLLIFTEGADQFREYMRNLDANASFDPVKKGIVRPVEVDCIVVDYSDEKKIIRLKRLHPYDFSNQRYNKWLNIKVCQFFG